MKVTARPCPICSTPIREHTPAEVATCATRKAAIERPMFPAERRARDAFPEHHDHPLEAQSLTTLRRRFTR